MSKVKQLVPAYCLHRPTGQAYLTVKRDGKRVPSYLGRWGTESSLVAYRGELTALSLTPSLIDSAVQQARNRSSDPSSQPNVAHPSACTVRSLWAAFMRWAPSYYKLPTGQPSRELENFRDAVRELLLRIGDKRTAEVTKKDLEEVREAMIAAKLSRGVVNKRITKILRIFRWGTEEDRGLVPEAVVAVLHLIRKLEPHRSAAPEYGPVVGISSEVVEKAISAANPVIGAMLRLQLLTGMRPGEARGLRKKMVQKKGKGWVADFGIEHKMAHRRQTRVIPLGPKTLALLRLWLEKCPFPESFVFRPTQQKGSRGKLQQFARYGYGDSVAWACEKAGVPAFAPNQVRHTVGEEVRESHGLEYVQALLGHRSRASSERYAPVVESLAEKVANKRG